MSRITFNQWVTRLVHRRKNTRKRRNLRRTPIFEQLGERITPTVNAFSLGGVLSVIGDNLDNTIEVSRNAGGDLLVNGGAVKIYGVAPTVASISRIQIIGLGGNDQLSLNEANGPLPSASLLGGSGNDTLISGAAADILFGGTGNDTLQGKGGIDFLLGGAGNDTLTGGAGNDEVFGQAGDDRMIWNPGDGSDVNEGGVGSDTVEVNGGSGAETFTVNPNGARVRLDRTDPAPFFVDIGTSENLVVNMNGGDDTFTASLGLAPLIQLAVDGGAGNDKIFGGDGNDRITAGDGDDFVGGGRGNDTISLGSGDDTFIWDPGDGSDRVEGQDGTDAMIFNGANISENIAISANGNRVRFSRDAGNITMDLNGLEQIDFNALGGADNITVNDLTGTDVVTINLDLARVLDSAPGENHTVTVNGTGGDDAISVSGSAGSATVLGLAARVNITSAFPPLDRLVVNGKAGDDVIDATGLAADAIQLTVNGDDGDDQRRGGAGADVLAGHDVLIGGPRVDTLDGGLGNNFLSQD